MGWSRVLVITLALFAADATSMQHRLHANPIRKVVNLLMGMQKQVEDEGKQAKELYDKFMCNAKKVRDGLEKTIKDAEEHIPQLESGIKQLSAEHQQLAEDLKAAAEDRDKATQALSTANGIRNKENAEFTKESSNQKADMAACAKAVAAIEKGQGGAAFLQSKPVMVLKRLSTNTDLLSDVDRDMLTSFLEGGTQEPSSGEVLGILKTMYEEMHKELTDMQADEDGAVADHEALVVSKKKEIKATTKAIEVKTGRKGEVAVELTKQKNDLEDQKEGLEEDSAFLRETKKSVEIKEKEFDEYSKTHSQELVALADTIKLLNDDDALDLFKKTMPSASAASFLQVQITSKQVKQDALHALRKSKHDPRLMLLSLALQGRKGGSFEVVLQKIDKLVSTLAKEQEADTEKKAWCLAEIDKTEDEIKWSERSVSDVEKVIASAKEELKAVLTEIAEVTQSIKESDAAVEEATTQRKAESSVAQKTLAENGAAKELLQMAKDRLNKFYNPKLAAELVQKKDETADTESVDSEAPSFVQVQVEQSDEDSNSQGYKKKSEESNGVIQMLNTLKEDLALEITEIETEEKEAQKDYETFMKDSADKRALDSKSLADKEAAKAKVETELQKGKEAHKGESESLADTKQELVDLHNDCDWLIANFDARKKAREDETDALTKAKAVLSGADYS